MWKKFQKYFSDYCEHSSIIGFNYVAEKRSRGERLLWILLIAIALGLSIYFIMEQYDKFDENPFVVSFATRETPIFTIPFPAVTICPFTKSNGNIFNYTNVIHRLWDNKTVSRYEMETLQYMSVLCDDDGVENVEEYFTTNYTFTNAFYDRLDQIDTTEDLLPGFYCDYMGSGEDCSELFTPIILDGGICFTFNMLNRDEIFRPNVFQYENYHTSQPKTQWSSDNGYFANSGRDAYPRRALLSGADNSLEVILLSIANFTDYLCFTDVGYSISVHAPNTIPQTKKDFYILPLDSAAQIILQPEYMTTSKTVKAYKTEDRKCLFSDERKLRYFLNYTQENCFLECLTNYTLDKCSCVNFFMPHDNTTDICGNSRRTCLEDAEYETKMIEATANIEEDIESLGCNCLPLCTQLKYQASTSRYPWKWKEFFHAHKKMKKAMNFTDQVMDQIHYSTFKIFFKNDQFLSYEKNELYGIFDFISNFGGLLGLFTGFSLLTVAEIVYYISVRLWCNKRLYDDVSGPPDDDI